MHSLISITILVIAISFLSVISGFDVNKGQEACIDYLKNYCGFQNYKTDYVDIYLPDTKNHKTDYANIYLDESLVGKKDTEESPDTKIKEILKEIHADADAEEKIGPWKRKEIEEKIDKANKITSIVNSTLDSAAFVKHLRTQFLKFILPTIIDDEKLKQKFQTSNSIDGDGFGIKCIEYIFNHIKDKTDNFDVYYEQYSKQLEDEYEVMDPILMKSIFLHRHSWYLDDLKGMKETPVTDFCQHEITSEETYRSFFVEIANFGMPSLVKK